MVRIWIDRINFNDGSELGLESNDIVVFVGPNNAGKTVSLKEIGRLLHTRPSDTKIAKEIAVQKEGDVDDLLDYLGSFSFKDYFGNPELSYLGYGFNVYTPNARSHWNRADIGLRELTPVFVNSLNTEERLQITKPAQSISLTKQAIQHPIHNLERDDSIEAKFSKYFREAFGMDLVVHRNAGNEVPLYVGKKPKLAPGEDRVSLTWVSKLEKLDLLHEQGDGMRAYVGVLLHALMSHHSIVFIDEPEAFLHPPQARLLGKKLVNNLPSKRQLFLATHSEDFLKGLLDANAETIKIVRIQRKGQLNKIKVLHNDEINKIWNDPLLRHSNILNGLFHAKVIVCEGDSDCRFYSAILAALYDDAKKGNPDVLFVHCGGKHRIPTAVKALRGLAVPISVIADFDILNSDDPLKNVFEASEGNWDDVVADWRLVKTAVDAKRPELVTKALKAKIDSVFEQVQDRIFPQDKVSEIQKALKKTSAWAEAKSIGQDFIPNGDPTNSFVRIDGKFRKKGLFVVPCGQLESFVRSVGNKGPKWVNVVLEKDLKNDPELEQAREFIKKVVG